MSRPSTDDPSVEQFAVLSAERDALIAERDTLVAELASVRAELVEAVADVVTWRRTAMQGWDDAADTGGGYGGDEAEAMRATLSWRVTRPLRMVRGQMGPSA